MILVVFILYRCRFIIIEFLVLFRENSFFRTVSMVFFFSDLRRGLMLVIVNFYFIEGILLVLYNDNDF